MTVLVGASPQTVQIEETQPRIPEVASQILEKLLEIIRNVERVPIDPSSCFGIT